MLSVWMPAGTLNTTAPAASDSAIVNPMKMPRIKRLMLEAGRGARADVGAGDGCRRRKHTLVISPCLGNDGVRAADSRKGHARAAGIGQGAGVRVAGAKDPRQAD